MKDKSKLSGAIYKKSQLPLKAVKKEMLFSFRDFDHTQGQTFLDWYENRLLHILLERIKEFCKFSRMDAIQNKCLKPESV